MTDEFLKQLNIAQTDIQQIKRNLTNLRTFIPTIPEDEPEQTQEMWMYLRMTETFIKVMEGQCNNMDPTQVTEMEDGKPVGWNSEQGHLCGAIDSLMQATHDITEALESRQRDSLTDIADLVQWRWKIQCIAEALADITALFPLWNHMPFSNESHDA